MRILVIHYIYAEKQIKPFIQYGGKFMANPNTKILEKELLPVEGYGVTVQILSNENWAEKGFSYNHLVHWDGLKNISINAGVADMFSTSDINMAILASIGYIFLGKEPPEDKEREKIDWNHVWTLVNKANVEEFAKNCYKIIYRVDQGMVNRIFENIRSYIPYLGE